MAYTRLAEIKDERLNGIIPVAPVSAEAHPSRTGGVRIEYQ